MKDLTCGDLERQNKALTAADEFLKRHKAENGEDSEEECRKVKTKSDRTVISKSKEKRRLDPSTALNQMVRFCFHKERSAWKNLRLICDQLVVSHFNFYVNLINPVKAISITFRHTIPTKIMLIALTIVFLFFFMINISEMQVKFVLVRCNFF